MCEEVLKVKNVTREFMRRKRKFAAVNDVTFLLKSGDFAAIVGRSGNGKSTLLNLIAGLLKPTRGSINVCGFEISSPNLKDDEVSKLRAENIGFVTQSATLLPSLTVCDNILLSLQIAKSAVKSEEEIIDKVSALLKRLNVADLLWCYPKELSGGEMRRVMIARAIINNPKLLILDEPTGDLDSDNTKVVIKILQEAALKGSAVLMVTHDIDAANCADCVYTMREGSLSL